MGKHTEVVVLNLAVRTASTKPSVVNKYYNCRLKYFETYLLSMKSEKRDVPGNKLQTFLFPMLIFVYHFHRLQLK